MTEPENLRTNVNEHLLSFNIFAWDKPPTEVTIFLVTQNFTLLLAFMHSDATGIKLKELMNLSKMVQKALSYDPQVFGAKIGGCIPEKRISLQSNFLINPTN